MKRRVVYIILGLLVVAAVGGVFVWQSQSQGEAPEVSRSTTVERGDLSVAVSASGKIKPEQRVNLTFEAPDRVAEVLIEVADEVQIGDVLARLDTRSLELQVEQSQAALASAEAQLAQVKAGPRPGEIEQAEANLRAAEARLSAAAANRDQVKGGPTEAQIAAAEAQVAAANTERELAQDAYDDIKEDGTQKEQANYDLYTAKKKLTAAQAELDRLLAGADTEELRAANADVWAAAAQRDAAQAQLDLLLAGPTEEDIADAEAKVAQAQTALELTELSLERATLEAPFDGVVSEVNVKAGEMAPTGRPAIVLLDPKSFHITISVDEMDVAQLSEGQSAEVVPDAFPEVLITGAVESIAPIATLEGGVVAYDVVIALAPTEVPIRTDMTANTTIWVEELTDVLKIPTWVVRVDRDTGQTYVHRRAGQNIERVDVELGARYEGAVQVLAGLSEGDELVWLDQPALGFGAR